MYYTVYKITNKINGKIYIGKHKTDDLDDGYFGSGKVLKRAIKKYGIENFIKEYIQIFDNEEDMNLLESKLVSPTFVANSSTYNLKLGGTGGFDYINGNDLNIYENHSETAKLNIKMARVKLIHEFESNTEFQTKMSEINSNKMKKYLQTNSPPFLGKKHSEYTKKTIGYKNSQSQRGAKNSQYGTCWITNGIENKKVSLIDVDIWINKGYHRGRTI